MLHASFPDVDYDLQERPLSVDLQEAMSVHFDESASFDLLKDKIMFPENDSLDADLDLDMRATPATKILEDRVQGENIVMPIAEADDESENELDCVGILEERLCDMKIMEEDDDVFQNKDRVLDTVISTPPERSNGVASQYFILPMCGFYLSHKSPNAAPPAPVRQFLRPKNNKMQIPAAPTARCNNPPPAPLLPKRNSMRPSISSALPMPASTSTALQSTKGEKTKPKMTMMPLGVPARKPMGSTAAQLQPPRPRASVSTMTFSGVQRPPASTLPNVTHSRAMSVPSTAASVRMQSQSQPQRNKQIVAQAAPSSSKASAAGASGLRRPSSLRAPTSRGRACSNGITAPRVSSAGAGTTGTRRVSMSIAVGGGGGGRLASTGINKIGPIKGDGHGPSVNARMMRRV